MTVIRRELIRNRDAILRGWTRASHSDGALSPGHAYEVKMQ